MWWKWGEHWWDKNARGTPNFSKTILVPMKLCPQSTKSTSLELNPERLSAKPETTRLNHGTGPIWKSFHGGEFPWCSVLGLRHSGVPWKVVTNASEEHNAAFFKVKDSWRWVQCASQNSVSTYQAARCNKTEDHIMNDLLLNYTAAFYHNTQDSGKSLHL